MHYVAVLDRYGTAKVKPVRISSLIWENVDNTLWYMTQAFKISCDWEVDKVDTADRKRVLAKRDHGFLLPKE